MYCAVCSAVLKTLVALVVAESRQKIKSLFQVPPFVGGNGGCSKQKYFMEAQGYSSTRSILKQDNKSAILLENNGHRSSSKSTQHIDIWYFLNQQQLSVKYCPTAGDMHDGGGRLLYQASPMQQSFPLLLRHSTYEHHHWPQTHYGAHRSVLRSACKGTHLSTRDRMRWQSS